ncbi:hypothetical protein HN51_053450 [Arachis hypogaea]|uniref:Defensin-like protein n=1 Tax=Arachis hypogaea TaxID=3818 RepID=A0A6B9V3H0_ARAHY|nr:uncharacterized protein DS421_19g638500 [Arachis hypogaea]
MAKLSLGNILVLVLLVSVVWMKSIVADDDEEEVLSLCVIDWDDEDCNKGMFENCLKECGEKYGSMAYDAHCEEERSRCACMFECPDI